MNPYKLLVILTVIPLMFNCKTKSERFSIEVRHFAGAPGLTIYYIVNDTYVQVDTDCDLQDCKRKTVYKRSLTQEQSESLLENLKSLHLDTLRKTYEPKEMIFDGLFTTIKLQGPDLPTKTISINNVELPTTDSLYRIIDNLIFAKKYKFYRE